MFWQSMLNQKKKDIQKGKSSALNEGEVDAVSSMVWHSVALCGVVGCGVVWFRAVLMFFFVFSLPVFIEYFQTKSLFSIVPYVPPTADGEGKATVP